MDRVRKWKVISQDFKKITFVLDLWVWGMGRILPRRWGITQLWEKGRPEEQEGAESEEMVQERSRSQKVLTFSANG